MNIKKKKEKTWKTQRVNFKSLDLYKLITQRRGNKIHNNDRKHQNNQKIKPKGVNVEVFVFNLPLLTNSLMVVEWWWIDDDGIV